MKFYGKKDIKKHVSDYISQRGNTLKDKVVIDIPAGSGYTSRILKDAGADVEAYDLFPEFFQCEGAVCRKADLGKKLDIDTGHADEIIFQEGIEHLPDQLHALHELCRVLKPGGKLLLTTPNYSSIRAKLSYLLNESEQYKLMPPNQIESVWFGSGQNESSQFYFGHIFLTGIQKLNILALLSGLRLSRIHYTRVNITSALLLPVFYPLILLSSYRAYRRAMKKNSELTEEIKKNVFKKQFLLMINPKVLVDQHLFAEFEKYCEPDKVSSELYLYHKYKTPDIQT